MIEKKGICSGSLLTVIILTNAALNKPLDSIVNLILKLLLGKETMEACIFSVSSMTRSLGREGQIIKS